MAKYVFVNILFLPPPDCVRCERHTVWHGTPAQFKPEGAVSWGGCRGLCGSCYHHLSEYNPDGLADYPRRNRRSLDVYEEFEFLKSQGPVTKEKAASVIGVTLRAFELAIQRAQIRLDSERIAA